MAMGSHSCDLCLYEGNVKSHKNVFIPTDEPVRLP